MNNLLNNSFCGTEGFLDSPRIPAQTILAGCSTACRGPYFLKEGVNDD